MFVKLYHYTHTHIHLQLSSQILSPSVMMMNEKEKTLTQGKVWNVMQVSECDHFESSQVMTRRTGELWSRIERVLKKVGTN